MTSSVLSVPNVQVTHVALNRIRVSLSVKTTPDDLSEYGASLTFEEGTTAEVLWLGDGTPELSLSQLASCIQEEFGVQVTRVEMRKDVGAEILSGLYEIPVALSQPKAEASRRTHTLKKTLRSGASMRFDGDVVVMGDVNPGAQVTATGNITVLGSLKGIAHAGAHGDASCFVMALKLQPIQIRIGQSIATSPSFADSNLEPHVATASAGQILFEPYRRFLSR